MDRTGTGLRLGLAMKRKKIQLTYLLRPHWRTLSVAFVAVLGEALTDLLEPWPLKIVFDYVLGSKKMPEWMSGAIHSTLGDDKNSILYFAAFSVIAIAIVGAISTYTEKYLTTSVGQWVMHDLRRTLYHHIQLLSLSYHDRKRTGDLISRVTSDHDASRLCLLKASSLSVRSAAATNASDIRALAQRKKASARPPFWNRSSTARR